MIVSNKKKVELKLRELTENLIGDDNFSGVTTIEISGSLNIRRNIVSQYLNELVEEKKATKSKTRPVLFTYVMDTKAIFLEDNENDVFKELVGYNGSLRETIETCKAAVYYPSKDMSVLLTGDSGVGKSYIASLLHKYAEDEGIVKKCAPYIVFNCADYADNPELLSANLFGYIKGSFTGADRDHIGALELADGGYLFLDEVHRLSPEGQEKLFVFMDEGVFKRLGEGKAERKASVRFIFATTENPNQALLQTFTRRIPLKINIPRLDERPIDERLTMIYKFFKSEAIKIDKNIKVARRVINYILSQKKGGNVGSLKNIVKFCCALAYKEQKNEEVIFIRRDHLQVYDENINLKVKQYYFEEFMTVNKDDEYIIQINMVSNDRKNRLNEMMDIVENLLESYESHSLSIDELRKNLTMELNKSLELIVYDEDEQEDNDVVKNIYLETVENTLKIIEATYGIKYYGNTSRVLSKVLLYQKNNSFNNDDIENYTRIEKLKSLISRELSKSLIVAEKIIVNLQNNLDCTLDVRVNLIIILYIFSMMSNESTQINALIVAHGYSTASSIASVANQLYGQFIFEAFDIPIDISPIEVKNKIKNYISKIGTYKGTIILVDMGSLVNINNELEDIMEGDLGIINNITTNIALDIAGRIINGQDVESMISGIEKNNTLMCKYIKAKEKKKAIITTCISGIGTAVKLRKLLKECIGDADIEIKEYEYNNLNLKGKADRIFNDYDVKLIISTTKLEIEGVDTILLQELISGDKDEILIEVLKDVILQKNIYSIRQDLIKMFSMDNLISRMTILNPKKIINEVENIIINYERIISRSFSVDLKMTLYIHISVLIERLMLKQGLEFEEDQEAQYKKDCNKFIEISKSIFSSMVNEYNLSIPLREIYIIQTIIESRIGKVKI